MFLIERITITLFISLYRRKVISIKKMVGMQNTPLSTFNATRNATDKGNYNLK